MRSRSVVRMLAAIFAFAAAGGCAADQFTPGPGGDGGSADADGGTADGAATGLDGGTGEVDGASVLDGATAGDGGLGAACNPFAPCAPGLYCDSTGCGVGVCRTITPSTNNDYAPVCGCDGITYFNGSIATAYGASVRAAGACAKNDSTTKACGGLQMDACSGSAKCGMVTISTNCTTPAGICWQLPPTCSSAPHVKLCAASCASVCDAIAANEPYFYDASKCP